MTGDPGESPSGASIPDTHRPILAGRDGPVAAPVETHSVDCAHVAGENHNVVGVLRGLAEYGRGLRGRGSSVRSKCEVQGQFRISRQYVEGTGRDLRRDGDVSLSF